MFSKLLKYEYRSTARVMLPVYGLFLLLVVCTALTRYAAYYLLPGALMDFISEMLATVSFLGFTGVLLVSTWLSIVRFYQMLGDSGYLYFSLPATPSQHILARAFVGTTWTMGFLLVCGLCVFLFGAVNISAADFSELLESPFKWILIGIIVLAVLEMIISIISGYFAMFLCCAIGAQWTQRRLLGTFVAYFVMGAISQVISIVALVAAWLFNIPNIWFESLSNLSKIGAASLNGFFVITLPMWIVLVYIVVLAAVCFYFTKKLLEKRLNLP